MSLFISAISTARNSPVGRYFIFLLAGITFCSAVITYILLAGGSEPLSVLPKHVRSLLAINIILLALLMGILAFRGYKTWKAYKANPMGSRLQRRVLLLFSLVAVLPTIIVSIFSGLFFNVGIQNWFDDRVQTAVEKSLIVAEAYLAEHKENIRADALAMAADLNRVARLALTDPREFNQIVSTQSTMRVLTESVVIQRNRIIAQGPLSFALAFETLSQDAIERANRGEVVLMTPEDDKVRALVKLDALPDAYLLVGRLIDNRVMEHMQSAQGAVYQYNHLEKQLNRLQLTFSVVFITLAFLLLLLAIGYGTRFARHLTRPISNLASAAERVRSGDFSVRVADTKDTDEIGLLARSFNRMTEQLQMQRGELIEANRRLDERRRFSEAVLSGVSAGVIALDSDKKITLINRSAHAILQSVEQPIASGLSINEVLPGIHELLVKAEQQTGETMDSIMTVTHDNRSISLHVRVTVEMLNDMIEGFIVTFDDITQLVSAQRTAAWADVARRVAHEIKNPLTPIQLSAERLKRKYLKFITEDQDSFIKYTDTIGKHVADIGRMVEEFVSFARMPTPIFTQEDLGALIKKTIFSTQVAYPNVDFLLDIPTTPVCFECDEGQVTQVFGNLFKNAAEAIEAKLAQSPQEGQKGKVTATLTTNEEAITVTVEDNGIGFPPEDAQKLLEPYITTRSKGTGLGLSIVKKIIEDHKGTIKLENSSTGGARVVLSFLQHCDINATNERQRVGGT
ncbi:MAG: PAS domain-containing sensor histidine kinase [Rickettsiales bacterium]|nr:PAS domain-containing sensor histidine kinase [Rickettsiales bacterium]